jgi:hypothetical protein
MGNDNYSVFVGPDGQIVVTTSGGATWSEVNLSSSAALTSVYFLTANVGYVGSYARIYKTSDGGNSWTYKYGSWHWIRDIYFLNANIGFAVGDYGTFLKTTNGGSSWIYSQLDELEYNYGVFFTSATEGIVLSEFGRILKTEDGGITWDYKPSGAYSDLQDVYFPDHTIGYAAGANGTILTNKSIFTHQPAVGPQKTFSIYPNPASDYLAIEGAEPFLSGHLSIIDINRKEPISQIVERSAIKVNVALLSCGIYFVRITNDRELAGVKFNKH